MLMPTCGNGSPARSRRQIEPNSSFRAQRASRTLTTNHPPRSSTMASPLFTLWKGILRLERSVGKPVGDDAHRGGDFERRASGTGIGHFEEECGPTPGGSLDSPDVHAVGTRLEEACGPLGSDRP